MASRKLVLLTGNKSGSVFNHVVNQKQQSIKRDELSISMNIALDKIEVLWNKSTFNECIDDVVDIMDTYALSTHTKDNIEKVVSADKEFFTRLYHKYLLKYGDGYPPQLPSQQPVTQQQQPVTQQQQPVTQQQQPVTQQQQPVTQQQQPVTQQQQQPVTQQQQQPVTQQQQPVTQQQQPVTQQPEDDPQLDSTSINVQPKIQVRLSKKST